MILKHFTNRDVPEWNEWCKITGFEPGKGTWPTASLLWFNQNGFDVKHIELFDFNELTQNGVKYLREHFNPDQVEWIIDHTNIEVEQERAKLIAAESICEHRAPKIDDIKAFIDNGYLIRAHVNARTLNNREGYVGHSIVVFSYDNNGFVIHDPGLPAKPNRHVPYDTFEKAFFTDGPESGELDAIKL